MSRFKTMLGGGRQYQNNLSGESFAQMVRQATGKTLPGPDEKLNREIIRMINEAHGGPNLAAPEISSVLRKRLKMENAHKQYLAVVLTRDILMACAPKLRSVYAELLYEIAVVAVRPSMAGTPQARKAKQAALQVLRGHERAGNSAFRAASGLGGPSLQQEMTRMEAMPQTQEGGGSKETRESILEKLERFGTIAKSHSDTFSDMLLHSEPGQLEESLIGDLMSEMKEMQEMLPKLIDKASNMEGERALSALAQGMEALDAMENAFKVHTDVKDGRKEESLKMQASQALEPRGSYTFPKEQPDLLSGGGTVATASEPSTPPEEEDDDPFGLNALQEALDQAAVSKRQGHDPFALEESVQAGPMSPSTPGPASQFGQPPQQTGNPFAAGGSMPQYPQTPGYSPQYAAPQVHQNHGYSQHQAGFQQTGFQQAGLQPAGLQPAGLQPAGLQQGGPQVPSPFMAPPQQPVMPMTAGNPFQQPQGRGAVATSANPFETTSDNPFGQDNAFGPPPPQNQYNPQHNIQSGTNYGAAHQPMVNPQPQDLHGFGSLSPFDPPTGAVTQGTGQNGAANKAMQQQGAGSGGQGLDPEWDNFFADRMAGKY